MECHAEQGGSEGTGQISGNHEDSVCVRQAIDAGTVLGKVREACQKGLSPSRYAYYKEVLEGASTALSRETPDFLALGQELLRSLAEELRREREVKKDIVFLPYKKSMWDSLESVWKAASEDAEYCNAYVIPIPYYDRNPDKSLGEMHCERDLFPKDVPTLNWEDVDLAAWHPDAIFIHSPYDGMNNVTCVKETYWSENLRKCTDKLVYIPYYVSAEPDTENTGSMDAIAPFALVPGVLNADMVIVQSEAVKEAFVRALLDRTNCKDRSYWEKRILGIGSPKFDKIFNEQKAAFDLPQEWRKIIKDKKTILYNTSLNVTLQHADSFCNKLRYVMDTFRNRDDVALWWRPHPLMEASLKAMRPGILGEYKAIVEQYRSEGWGISDDSAELERAIVCTDAYYGDASSVMELYRRTGKPMMVQDIGIDRDFSLQELPVWSNTFCVYDQMIYFMLGKVNLLMKHDIRTGKTEALGSIPNEEFIQETLIGSIHFHGGKLFLVPTWGKELAVYEIAKRRFLKIPIRNPDGRKGLFLGGAIHGDYLYCIPFYYDRIVKLNMATMGIEKTIEYEEEKRNAGITSQQYLNSFTYNRNGEVLAIWSRTNMVLSLDMKKDFVQIEKVDDSKNGYSQIACTDKYVFLGGYRAEKILRIDWARRTKEKVELPIPVSYVRDFDEKLLLVDNIRTGDFALMDEDGKIVFRKAAPQNLRRNNWHYSDLSIRVKRSGKAVYACDTILCKWYKIRGEKISEIYMEGSFANDTLQKKWLKEEYPFLEIPAVYPLPMFLGQCRNQRNSCKSECDGIRIGKSIMEKAIK